MGIKAVAFDYGGVICRLPSKEISEELGTLTGLSPLFLDNLNFKYRGDYDRGACNGEEYFNDILSSAGIFLDEASLWNIARTDMEGWKVINTDTVQLMRDIKKAGVKIAIFSNMPNDFLVWARENIEIFSEVDVSIFSCEHYLVKPEKEIYELLRDKLQMNYEEIVFFDDSRENINAACELGIKGFTWENPETARAILKKADPVFSGL